MHIIKIKITNLNKNKRCKHFKKRILRNNSKKHHKFQLFLHHKEKVDGIAIALYFDLDLFFINIVQHN